MKFHPFAENGCIADEYFSGSEQTVDWYHARQYLFAACAAFHPEGSLAAQRWMNKHSELLFQGHAEAIATTLYTAAEEQPGADAEAGYFETNHRRMNYMELREQGWVIGSGVIESGGNWFAPSCHYGRRGVC